MSATAAPSSFSSQAQELRRQFLEVRNMSMRLTESLSPEDQMLQSMPEASPAKWHLAHTTWFFETFVLAEYARGYQPLDARYKYLFNSYYKQLGAHPYRGARGLMSRPSLEQVHVYRAHVDKAMSAFLDSAPEEALTLAQLGINHEQQHQELILTDIKHALWSSPLPPEYRAAIGIEHQPAPPVSWAEFEGGTYAIGHDGSGFAFDNEGPRHQVLLRPFRIASRLVTNGEYLEFMRDGGYRRPELWLSDGWDTVNAQNWSAPLYWELRQDDNSWLQFTSNGFKPLQEHEPVCHISYYEADAYARWRGMRLPTEEEWEVVAERTPARGTLLEDCLLQPQAAKGDGVQQIFGEVWEWTSSPYVAYPGFRPAAGLIGEYNGKFMCNQLVLRGGSCATPASHIRASYRNFFPPQARWQFSGIRLADDRA